MGKRREGREAAVQFLVYCDLNQGAGVATAAEFWELRPASKPIRDFAVNLVEGVLQHRGEIDERISRYAENYELGRLAVVDRNILRLAIYEMLHRPRHPAGGVDQRGHRDRQTLRHRGEQPFRQRHPRPREARPHAPPAHRGGRRATAAKRAVPEGRAGGFCSFRA